MIIKTSERSGGKQLALHLSNLEDNDHVGLHKVHGCMARDIEGALTEMYAIDRATRCKKHMFLLSLSPPKEAKPPSCPLLVEADIALILEHDAMCQKEIFKAS